MSCAGLVPVMTLASQTALPDLLAEKVHIAEPKDQVWVGEPGAEAGHVDRGDVCGRRLHRGCRYRALGRDEDPVRWRVCTVDGGNVVAGVHLRSCPPVGVGAA